MASIINVLSSAAKKEAIELAEKLGISLEEAAQRVYQKYYPSSSVEKVSPSLSEAIKGKGFTAREADIPVEKSLVPSKKQEAITPEIMSDSTALVPVGPVKSGPSVIYSPSKLPRELEERGDVTYKPYASETAGAEPPKPRISKSDSSASEDYEDAFGNLGAVDTSLTPEQKRNLVKGAVGTAAVTTGLATALSQNNNNKPVDPASGIGPVASAENSAPNLVSKSAEEISKIETKEQPPSKDEAQKSAEKQISLLGQLSKLKYNNPRDESAIQAERDRAEELYDKARSRNEWLEVAQTLAAAIAQFGAAQSGLASGVAARMPAVAMTDYGARTGRSERDLERKLRNIEQDASAKERASKEKTGTEEFNIRMQLEQEKLRERQAEKQIAAGKETAEDRQIRSLQSGDIRSQLQQKQKELEAASQLANQLAMEKDMSSKSLKKLEERIPGLLGKAGVDPTDLALIEQEATERGYIWDSINPEKKTQLIKERILDKKKQEIKDLRSAFDSIVRSRQAAPAPATMAPAPAAQAEKGTVTVIHKATGQAKQFPANSPEAQRAKSDPEFEVR